MQNDTAPMEICNHTSVGMMVFNAQHHLLLIERKKYPYGYACPSGHVDNGETYEQAALRELREEVGLEAVRLDCVLDTTVDIACRRPYGDWHRWKVYLVQATGELNHNLNETKQAGWYNPGRFSPSPGRRSAIAPGRFLSRNGRNAQGWSRSGTTSCTPCTSLSQ